MGWHCDEELLFGELCEAKLIVSVSLAAPQSSDGDVSPVRMMKATCAGLAMVTFLVMDGQCQDEFLHCTSPSLEQEQTDVTFRWIKQHSVSCPLRTGIVCCLPRAVTRVVGYGAFWAFWVLLGVLCMWRVLFLLIFPSYVQDSGYRGMPIAGHALWAEVGVAALPWMLSHMESRL